MSRRRDEAPPPSADAPSLSILDMMNSSSSKSRSSKDKTTINLSKVDQTRARTKDKTVVNLTKVDETRAPSSSGSKDKTVINLTKADQSRRPSAHKMSKVDEGASPSPRPTPTSSQPTIRARTIVSSSRSQAPPSAPSTFQRPDREMASRQTRFKSLPPAEQKKQEEWVQEYLSRAAPCPADFPWRREDKHYRCFGSSHVITDELIAEGKGGFYIYPAALYRDPYCTVPFFGPYYQTNGDGTYYYAGVQPKPKHAPDRMVGMLPIFDDIRAESEVAGIINLNHAKMTDEMMMMLNPSLYNPDGSMNETVLTRINELREEAERVREELERKKVFR